ncbi:allantoinase [Pseudohyphozyma bogoriensis]|nr:allantoinase [Pseudohyphozyma bogoriensis]
MAPKVIVSTKAFTTVTPTGAPATVVLSNEGTIASIEAGVKPASAFPDLKDGEYLDLGDLWLLPGLVDAHVHLNEPGRTEWEGFATGTSAAASGGVTTVIDMPLNAIPPTTTVPNFKEKMDASVGKCRVDVGFWGGVIPGNENDLVPLSKAGVKGFKCFLIESGVDEFPAVNEEEVLKAMPLIASEDSLFLFHAELDITPEHTIPPAADTDLSHHTHTPSSPPTSYSTFLSSRPPALEESAIALILRCAAKHPTLKTHIVHLSASSAIPALRSARAAGTKISVETCFHYLCLTAEQIAKGETLYKCCPPIRESLNREALWKGLLDGDIDFVVSDHSPCTVELKRLEEGDFMKAWGGIGGLGLGLSLLWTEAARRRVGMERVLQWVAERPAKQVGLEGKKGSLVVGGDADWVVFDPTLEFKVDKSELHFKNRASPYEGLLLKGAVLSTYLRGEKIFDRTSGFKELGAPRGQLLL